MARKGKYNKWLEDENLILLEVWARDGLIDTEIAQRIGINVKTLYEWKRKYSKLSKALRIGKEVADYTVERALFKKAMTGDVGAIKMWLCNRAPDRWADKRKVDLKHEGELNVTSPREEIERRIAVIASRIGEEEDT